MQAAQHRKLNTREAAEYLGISASTLAKLRVYGGGARFFKFGRRVLYDMRDLDSWAAERRRTSTSDPGHLPDEARSGTSSRMAGGPSGRA